MSIAGGRITASAGSNLIGVHAQDRNQEATCYVGNIDPQVISWLSCLLSGGAFLWLAGGETGTPHGAAGDVVIGRRSGYVAAAARLPLPRSGFYPWTRECSERPTAACSSFNFQRNTN